MLLSLVSYAPGVARQSLLRPAEMWVSIPLLCRWDVIASCPSAVLPHDVGAHVPFGLLDSLCGACTWHPLCLHRVEVRRSGDSGGPPMEVWWRADNTQLIGNLWISCVLGFVFIPFKHCRSGRTLFGGICDWDTSCLG